MAAKGEIKTDVDGTSYCAGRIALFSLGLQTYRHTFTSETHASSFFS